MFNGFQALSTDCVYEEGSHNAICIVLIDKSRPHIVKFSFYVLCSLKVH